MEILYFNASPCLSNQNLAVAVPSKPSGAEETGVNVVIKLGSFLNFHLSSAASTSCNVIIDITSVVAN